VFWQQLINGLALGSSYSLVAMGYTLVFGVLYVLNMAHGDVLMITAYVGWFLVSYFKVGFFTALIGAMLSGFILGMILERVAIRPLFRSPKYTHISPLISTIGVAIFLQNLAMLLFTPDQQRYPTTVKAVFYQVGPLIISSVQILMLVIAAVLMIALKLSISYTSLGRAIRATAERPVTASYLGVNVSRVLTFTVAISSALGAAAGVLLGVAFGGISPLIGFNYGMKGLIVLIIGGLGSIEGAMIGGIMLGVLEIFTVGYLSSAYRDAIAFAVLFLVLMIRPNGLFGESPKT